MSQRRIIPILLVLVLPLLVSPPTAEAQRRSRRSKAAIACKMSYLPFAAGRSWTYQYVIPPGVEDLPGGLKAKIPETVTIKVKSVEAKSGAATITLQESYREVSQETILTCDAEGLVVPLQSFFFAGELPGALGMTTENVDTKGKIYPGSAGLKRGESMYVEIKADVIRASAEGTKVKHPAAKLEIERQITVGASQEVEVEHGIHKAAFVEVAISGRSSLAPMPDKKIALPEGNAQLWFASGVGLVRAYNRLGQGWELVKFVDGEGNNID